MNNKHRKTLRDVFSQPVLSGILWDDVESLLTALGATRREGSGSRMGFSLNGIDLVLQRPHPQKEVDKGAIKSVRRFLTNAGVMP